MTKNAKDGDTESERTINLDLPEGYKWILDHLPFGISVQRVADQVILYENEKVKSMVGSYFKRPCYNRWMYIAGWGEGPCPDCPAVLGFTDKYSHKVFRKTRTKTNEDLYVEIQSIPIVEDDGSIDKYIEIIYEASVKDKAKVLSQLTENEIVQQLEFAIMKFGTLGGDIVLADDLTFRDDIPLDIFLSKLTVYVFTGLIQGYEHQSGFYGPLPVLDKTTYFMHAYLFRLYSDQVVDHRKQGKEICLLLMFYPRDLFFMFEKRTAIENFITKHLSQFTKLEELNDIAYTILKSEIKNFIEDNIN